MNRWITGLRYQIRQWLPLALVVLIIVSYTGLVALVAGHRARVRTERRLSAEYEEKLDQQRAQILAQVQEEKEEAANRAFAEANSQEAILRAKAEKLAKALYAFRGNTDWDIITAIWCFFNRVDITTGEYAYLTTLEDVIDQPDQWMGYSEDNPVLERLYKLACSQLEIWLNGGHRPCSAEYVFLVWSPSKTYLKTTLEETRQTKTWSYTG